jgi:hypothetical protein
VLLGALRYILGRFKVLFNSDKGPLRRQENKIGIGIKRKLGIKLRTILKSPRAAQFKNIRTFYCRWLGSQQITKIKVGTVLLDTLYL